MGFFDFNQASRSLELHSRVLAISVWNQNFKESSFLLAKQSASLFPMLSNFPIFMIKLKCRSQYN